MLEKIKSILLPSKKEKIARIFSFAMAQPKPFHRKILENWALMPEAFQFSLITDCPDLWQPLIRGLKNIDLVVISQDEWFRAAESAIGRAESGHSFSEVYSEDNRNGWVACSLRPLLPQICEVGDYPIWGWIDWDVFVNPSMVENHVRTSQADLIMFPPSGFMWEHFKLFRRDIDILPLVKKLVADGVANHTQPMCASLSYAVGATEYNYSRDSVPQEQIAVHWAYSDKLSAENGFSVVMDSKGHLKTESGSPVMFFVADTQVKDWTEGTVEDFERSMKSQGEYIFEFVPKLT